MAQRKKNWIVFGYCLLAAGVCLLICSKSSPLYPINDWTDANAYFSCGKGMIAGRVMYRDLYEHKGPLLYALHALCSFVYGAGFLGVFGMEILAVALFLLAAYKLLTLYGVERSAWVALPLIAALVCSSFSFQQGDSAEELCMPMLAWSLYGLLRWLRQKAPRRMGTRELLLHGVLCGCVLWVKFTMLGFYIPWVLGMMLLHLLRRDARSAWTALGWFAAGIGVATVPWLLYFGVNGAILPWLKTYLYDNIFLYQDETALSWLDRCKAMLRSGWEWFTLNWAYTVPMTAGLVWLTVRRGKGAQAAADGAHVQAYRAGWPEKAFLWCTLGFAALGVFIGGKNYVYYGLILAAFTPLLALPLCALLDRLPRPRRGLQTAVALLCVLGAGALCLSASRNTPDLLKPRADTMQYRVAEIVSHTPNATLLNYGFMDAGFYTACNIAPSVKYFHQTNVHLQEMLDEQIRYIDEGVTDYVVTRGRQPDSITERYTLVATEKAPDTFWYDSVYLYKRKDLD